MTDDAPHRIRRYFFLWPRKTWLDRGEDAHKTCVKARSIRFDYHETNNDT